MRKWKGRVGKVCPRGSLVRTPVPRVLRTDCALAAGRSVRLQRGEWIQERHSVGLYLQ